MDHRDPVWLGWCISIKYLAVVTPQCYTHQRHPSARDPEKISSRRIQGDTGIDLPKLFGGDQIIEWQSLMKS